MSSSSRFQASGISAEGSRPCGKGLCGGLERQRALSAREASRHFSTAWFGQMKPHIQPTTHPLQGRAEISVGRLGL